jgi:hypothetical protein
MSKHKCTERVKILLLMVVFTLAVLLVSLAVYEFFYPHTARATNFIIISLTIAIIILLQLAYGSTEINLFGASLKFKEKIANIEQRQLLNRVVYTVDKKYYHIDSKGNYWQIENDSALVNYLSNGRLIYVKESTINPVGVLPRFETSILRSDNEIDYFIEYHNSLYYQRSLSWIYLLAELQGVEKYGNEIKDWKLKGIKWTKALSPMSSYQTIT